MQNNDDTGQYGQATTTVTTPETPQTTTKGGRYDKNSASVRERALAALRHGEFNLAEQILSADDPSTAVLIENLRIYQAELEMQNEELRKSQRTTESALERFSAMFQQLPIAELVLDRYGLIVEANPSALQLLQLRNTQYHQYFLARMLLHTDQARLISAWERLTVQESLELTEVRMQLGNGSSLVVDLHIAQLPAPEGQDQQNRLICAVIDRTEQARQREALGNAYDRLESSRECYRVLAEFSPEWDYWLGLDNHFIHVSPACQDITGYSASEFIENPELLETIMHPEDLDAWQQHLAHPLDSNKHHVPLSFRIRTRDGQQKWIDHICSTVLSEDGRALGRRGVNRDVTSRHQAEKALQRSEALLNATSRLARVGGWEFDADNKTLRWTQITRLLHEVDDDFQPTVETALEFYDPHDRAVLHQAIKRALSEGCPYELELRLQTARGGKLWVRTNAEAVYNDNGSIGGLRGSIQDITERVKAEQARRESEQQYRTLFESAGQAMLILREERCVLANRAAQRLFGYDEPTCLLGKHPCDVSPAMQPDGEPSTDKASRFITRAMRGEVQHFEWEHLHADGSPVPVQVTMLPIEFGSKPALYATLQDLTEQRAAERREVQARTVFENTSEGIIITDPEQRILAVNRAFTELTGYTENKVLGQTPSMLKSGRQNEMFYQSMWAALQKTGQWRGEFWNRRKTGEIYPQLSTISTVHDQAGRLTNYIAVFGDITQIKQSEQELYKLAHEDALTCLPNRSLLRARVEQSLSRAERDGSMCALLFLDLDLFKTVNDTLGHTVGDALLQRVAESIKSQVRAADSIARIGGDEFVVLIDDLSGPNGATQLARRLLDIFKQPFDALGRELYITASIGISIFPTDGRDMDTLLSNADVAMYQAKEHGRNNYRFFEQSMTEGAIERLRLETALRGALARQELTLVYQPQVKLSDRCMYGAEVLLRWQHPELGQIPPERFIPIAEELGLIGELGAWVLENACAQLAEWDAHGLLIPRLAVNLSVQQLERIDLADTIAALLARTHIEGDRLELEVTETMLMRHTKQVITNLHALREIGITIAFDDFGSGFSSLGYLKNLPINRLKIDKTLVDNLTQDPNDDTIARTVIALGRGLGLDVLAEGVETEVQAEFLLREHCDEAQGYLFSRPMSADQIVDFQIGHLVQTPHKN